MTRVEWHGACADGAAIMQEKRAGVSRRSDDKRLRGWGKVVLAPDELLTFHKLVDYEFRSASRYRRFVALVMLASQHYEGRCMDLLNGAIRKCDEVVNLEGATAILMPETPRAGALAAIKRYKAKIGESADVRYGVAAFPVDACSAAATFLLARQRLNRAEAGEPGAVVAEG